MKKVFFAFVALTVVVLSACDSKAPETTETVVADTTTVQTVVETVTTVDTTVTVDTVTAQ